MFGTNKLGMIDPDTMEITERLLPQGTRPRRIAIGSDEMVYYTDFSRGYLGRLAPDTGRIKVWASQGGKESRLYGIAIIPDGRIG
jgi:virginiamycin B lyase